MARKAKFHYNPDTLTFERVEITFRHVMQRIGIQILSGLCFGAVAFVAFSLWIDSPQEKMLKQENAVMKSQYELLNERVEQLQAVISDLQQRDDNLYRVIFQADPIPLNVRSGGFSNSQRYNDLSGMSNSKLLITTSQKTDELAKQIYIQSKSYNELVELAKTNEERLQNIPAIQPILNKDLSRVASGYGMRIDPVYHVSRMHYGMDFTAPIGTDIYATGNGVVSFAGRESGYGNLVKIDHGFHYITYYAHLSAIKVRVGQKVTRGEVIGLVGISGKATGPHLHYEVHFKGVAQNPQNYYYLDLSPEDYDRMVQLSQNSGQILD
ncbi:MAG: M23 family metallopeptidase [Prevotellaceae bacterium]|jgi:murein DD-endopeptidase MepM/ murein hydrolase activator NlpD|nr:M23 family metallopeptidase [Prevotellaceae bacterium]